MDDGSLISVLFDRLNDAYVLLQYAQSDGPLHSGIRNQWYQDRKKWTDKVDLLCTTYLEGWTPPE